MTETPGEERAGVQREADVGLQEFLSARPNMGDLRTRYAKIPSIMQLLRGDFADRAPNVYTLPNGTIVSWTIDQGILAPRKNPTYGRFPKGEFEFGIKGFSERMTVLEGVLQLEFQENCFWLSQGTSKIIYAPQDVIFSSSSPVIYICEYNAEGFKKESTAEAQNEMLDRIIAKDQIGRDAGRQRSRSGD